VEAAPRSDCHERRDDTGAQSDVYERLFHLQWRVSVYSERHLLSMSLSEKMLNFPLEVMFWLLLVDIEDVLWEIVNTYTLLGLA